MWAELVSKPEDLKRFLAVVNQKYVTTYGLDMVDPTVNCTFRMRPVSVFGLRTDDFTGSPTRWVFRD